MSAQPDGLEPDALVYGADYNPEQWPSGLLETDLALMREAGVNRVSVGIFSWARLEPRSGRFDGEWLDRVLDGLAASGIGVNLATPTASPPQWLLREHPEVQACDADGRRVPPGGRMSWCPNSPVFRHYAGRIVQWMATRFGTHPALRLWHIANELGNENAGCWCDNCAAAFRRWVADRYESPRELNLAWGTAFWGHDYGSFDEVVPPRTTRNPPDPALALDYRRFYSDALRAHYRFEYELVKQVAPGVPATTNFMVAQAADAVDYAAWTANVDLVANDHYTVAADPDRRIELALSADRTRGLAGGEPWLLMEHSTSAVNWQPRNRAKEPGEMLRDTMSHLARGADGAMFFQWRASRSGSEQYHSAMVGHAGTDTRVWREAVELGEALRRLAPLRGSRVERADVALIWDIPSQWALRAAPPPTVDFRYETMPTRLHRALYDRRIGVDVVEAGAGLDGRKVVLVPTVYLEHPGLAERLAAAAEAGAQVVITALSGAVDGHGSVITGGYPGALRELVGGSAEELLPLPAGDSALLDNGWRAGVWTEDLRVVDAEVVARYVDGALGHKAAILRRRLGRGGVTYLGCELDVRSTRELMGDVVARAGVGPIAVASDGVDVVRRVTASGDSFLFCINHGTREASVQASGIDLITGEHADGTVRLPAGRVAVIQEGTK